ncbi:class II fructose-bisphosphatase [Candidatus Pelagibacter sp.]|nr:class II fructose-bisphosphatase [Candidatus Pelagibacter sp.]
MTIDKKYISKLIRVTSKAALASYYLVGKENKILADKAAVDSMRNELNKLDIRGEIVIGEGELDEAPMLYIGEEIGTMNGPEMDIAVDPLEGTNFVAKNLPGALSVIALAKRNNLFKAPETYMEKISANVQEKKVIDLDYSIKKNIYNLSDYLNKKPQDLTACILDRPRHRVIIEELNNLKVKLKLINDGDVSGALLVTNKKHNVDIFLGTGGGPEGVLAAAALDAFDCTFQGRFLFDSDDDKTRAKSMGIKNLKKKYELHEIISGDTIFCATGITSGDLVKGIKIKNNNFISETLVTHKSSKLKKIIKNDHKI